MSTLTRFADLPSPKVCATTPRCAHRVARWCQLGTVGPSLDGQATAASGTGLY